MSIQTTYTGMEAGFAGQIANIIPYVTVSKVSEGGYGFGLAVVRGTADNQAKLPSATGQDFQGVSVYTLGAYAQSDDVSAYGDEEVSTVLKKGFIWVITEEAVVPGDDVFFRHTAGAGGTVIGSFRSSADTATADQITGATFESTAGAGEIALIYIS